MDEAALSLFELDWIYNRWNHRRQYKIVQQVFIHPFWKKY
jgi:hypothetical protein